MALMVLMESLYLTRNIVWLEARGGPPRRRMPGGVFACTPSRARDDGKKKSSLTDACVHSAAACCSCACLPQEHVDLLGMQALLYGAEHQPGLGARVRMYFRLQMRVVDS